MDDFEPKRSTLGVRSDVYLELNGMRKKFAALREGEELTIPALIELLICHAAEKGLDPEFIRDFEPISKPGRPKEARRLGTLEQMRGEGWLYPT